jgi:Holliday junction resolvase RusA-like endonuclease
LRVTFTIQGEAASKANSRRLQWRDGKPRFVKSRDAIRFAADALIQIPMSARVMYDGPVRVTLEIFYRTERRDLDESLVLDALQAQWTKGGRRSGILTRRGVIVNDRQVREKHVFHSIDRANPRVNVVVESLE